MQMVDDYIAVLVGEQKVWVERLVNFMRAKLPELEETFVNYRPTYKGDGFYIAFDAQNYYFSFYTDDTRALDLLAVRASSVNGRGCARIKYSAGLPVEALFDICMEIVNSPKPKQKPAIFDIFALKKWSKIPRDEQQLLVNNVHCAKCGTTTIVNYSMQDSHSGLVLKGACQKCGGPVARFIEGE